MSSKDVRWMHRFSNFSKALDQLSKFIQKKNLNELEQQGLIQSFEYNYELAWNTMKDFYESQGETNIQGSRDGIRLAFKRGLIQDGENWMDMIKSRSLTSHTYNEEIAKEIIDKILNSYFLLFNNLRKQFEKLKEQQP